MTAIAQRKELKFVSRSLGRDTITTTTRPLLGVVTRTTIHPNGTTAADTFTYGYTPNSSLIATVTGPAHTVTNTWEPTRDVLKTKLNKETVGTASYPSSFGYTVNALGQRETVGPVLDENDAPVSTYSVSWGWDYNDRGELQSADHGDDATPNTHDRFYAFDAIGNRNYVRTGVYADSGGTQLDYIANDLNQYTVANGVSLPTTPTPAPHDLDGNLRFDGGVNKDNEAREYLWDAENRLIAVKRVSDSATVVSFLYDAQSRRIAKMAGTTTTLYVYDSFNCIAEYSISNNQYSISRARTWGMDLSGSLQGAGGVGGLLAEKQGANSFYPTYDGNGNVSEYLAADGTVAAHFEYDPFGNTVVNTDSSGQFSYRFSTKPLDYETGLYYYQYRYYDPVTGRWPSRDPIGENGGANLYGFVNNNVINKFDLLGLDDWYINMEGDCVWIIGGTVSTGIVIDDDNLLDSGLGFSIGFGWGKSLGFAGGVVRYLDEFEGKGYEFDGNASFVSGIYGESLDVNDKPTGNVFGLTVGPGGGLSGSKTNSWTLTLNTIITFLKSIPSSNFLPNKPLP